MKLKYLLLFLPLSITSVSFSQEDIITNKQEKKTDKDQKDIITNEQDKNQAKEQENIISNQQDKNPENKQVNILSNNPEISPNNKQEDILKNKPDSLMNGEEDILTNIQVDSLDNCSCWDSLYNSSDTAYAIAFEKMENNFISKTYLDSSSSESYIRLIQALADSNNYFLLGVEIDPMLILGFKKCFLLISCDLPEFVKIRVMNNKMAGYNNISPGVAFTDVLEIFNVEDFENKLIRHYILTFYSAAFFTSFTTVKSPEKIRDLPEPIEEKQIVKRNILNVYAASNEKVYVNDSLIKITSLKKSVYDHVSDTTGSKNSPEVYDKYIEGKGTRKISKQSISYTTDVNTSYDFYTWVKEIMVDAYNERRNEIALAEFGMSYKEMLSDPLYNKEKIRTVQKMLHIKITEIEASE